MLVIRHHVSRRWLFVLEPVNRQFSSSLTLPRSNIQNALPRRQVERYEDLDLLKQLARLALNDGNGEGVRIDGQTAEYRRRGQPEEPNVLGDQSGSDDSKKRPWDAHAGELQCLEKLPPRPRGSLSQDILERRKSTSFARGGTIVAELRGKVDQSDVVSKFPILQRMPEDPLIIVLVTPSFAQYIQDGSGFFMAALNQVFSEALRAKHSLEENISGQKAQGIGQHVFVNVVTAVVDKVPGPGKGKDEGLRASEGVSFWVTGDSEAAVGSLSKRTSISSPLKRMPSSDKKPHISVAFPLGAPERHFVDIPLANTLFVNGQPSTMLAARWRMEAHPFRATLEESFDLDYLRLNYKLPLLEYGRTSTWQMQHNLSLKFLTPPRKIGAGMGNVIRRVSKGEGANVIDMPASQDLEKAVDQYFETNGLEPSSLAVWALIYPKKPLGENWEKARDDPKYIAQAIYNGAHLHRVLSGGGGWGQKAGLLSLDPETTFKSQEKPEGELAQDPPIASLSSIPSLGDIAKPGDWVQFLTSQATSPVTTSHHKKVRRNQYVSTTLAFGVAPSTLDDMPEQSPSSDTDINPGTLSFLNKTFGAYSQLGLVYTRKIAIANRKYSALYDPGQPRMGEYMRTSAHDWVEVAQSKFDVPHASLRFDSGWVSHNHLLLGKEAVEDARSLRRAQKISRKREMKGARRSAKPRGAHVTGSGNRSPEAKIVEDGRDQDASRRRPLINCKANRELPTTKIPQIGPSVRRVDGKDHRGAKPVQVNTEESAFPERTQADFVADVIGRMTRKKSA